MNKKHDLTDKEVHSFEEILESRGYKKILSSKYNSDDDYEYYKAVYDDEENLSYQIFFKFWDFEKYCAGSGYSVSVAIMPISLDGLERRDLNLSVDWATDVDKIELLAEKFYKFITEFER